VFISSAVVFGIMAVAGYTTRMDLSKFGSILMMIFFGALAVYFINFFLGSAQLDYIISFVFVALMIGLTAYYMQMLKRIGAGIEYGTQESKKTDNNRSICAVHHLYQFIYFNAPHF